ncbi:hypothetical protein [Streptomyces sp. NPDC057623]
MCLVHARQAATPGHAHRGLVMLMLQTIPRGNNDDASGDGGNSG